MQEAVSWMIDTLSVCTLFRSVVGKFLKMRYQKISYIYTIVPLKRKIKLICQMLINEGHSIADFLVMPQVV